MRTYVEETVDEEDPSNSAGAQYEDEEGNRYSLIDGLNDTDKMTDVYVNAYTRTPRAIAISPRKRYELKRNSVCCRRKIEYWQL